MTTPLPNTWMVRAGERGRLLDLFLDKAIIALGWDDIGELPSTTTYQQLKEKLSATYPDDAQGRINQSAGQIWRFFHEFKEGDNVITYDPNARCYYSGVIQSGYQFDPSHEYHHTRKVRWDKFPYDRDRFSTEAKNQLGAILTIFVIPTDVWAEFKRISAHSSAEEIEKIAEASEQFAKEEEERVIADLTSRSNEFIKDLLASLTWQEMEEATAGLFRAMGYKTRMTSKGSDLGSDIHASPDGLGMIEPRIKIAVKHRVKSKDKVGTDQLRNFIGGLRTEKGIYVSTTGFTKEAHYEAERANFSITLVDADLFVELLIENYDTLEPTIKALLPLRKIYWPA